MRFLADMGVAGSTVKALRIRGHDAIHLREGGLGRLPDTAILEQARREGRIVLTFDLDFGDLLAAGLYDRPSVIIFRLRNQTPASVTPRLSEVLSERCQELEQGAVVIVEEARYRVRRLPIITREESPSGERSS
jgi:predicted nuclease of predicted toxin-antitoxin system